jgi:hypothetical protein
LDKGVGCGRARTPPHADAISVPGAKRATHAPELVYCGAACASGSLCRPKPCNAARPGRRALPEPKLLGPASHAAVPCSEDTSAHNGGQPHCKLVVPCGATPEGATCRVDRVALARGLAVKLVREVRGGHRDRVTRVRWREEAGVAAPGGSDTHRVAGAACHSATLHLQSRMCRCREGHPGRRLAGIGLGRGSTRCGSWPATRSPAQAPPSTPHPVIASKC